VSDGDAFLQEILAHPDDDGPRLIYADWLEERGDPRADFIRVQCELARLTEPEPPPLRSLYPDPYRQPALRPGQEPARFQALLARQRDLLPAQDAYWQAVLGAGAGDLRSERGFVATLTTTAAHFLSRAEEWFRRTPLRQVRLEDAGDHVAALAASPYLGRLRGVELDLSLDADAQAQALLRGGPWPGLRRLYVHFGGRLSPQAVDEATLSLFLEAPAFPGLEYLYLPGAALSLRLLPFYRPGTMLA
jgi:uncharacterized protein (TIGR02996 family)